jgi:hypothetical protein
LFAKCCKVVVDDENAPAQSYAPPPRRQPGTPMAAVGEE